MVDSDVKKKYDQNYRDEHKKESQDYRDAHMEETKAYNAAYYAAHTAHKDVPDIVLIPEPKPEPEPEPEKIEEAHGNYSMYALGGKSLYGTYLNATYLR